jgi:multidrug resistance efflux pump
LASGSRIPTPWSHSWRRFRYSALPAISFCACAAAVGWMWSRQIQLATALGEAEIVRLDLIALTDGRLAAGPENYWTLFDETQAGQILVRLDDRPVQAELDVLRTELERLRSDLDAAALQLKLDQAALALDHRREGMRLAWESQRRRLDVLDRKAEIETDRVELKRLAAQYDFLKAPGDTGVVSQQALVDAKLLRDVVARRIEATTGALGELQQQAQWAVKRLQEYPELDAAEFRTLLGPYEAAIATQEARIRQLQLQVDALELPAPLSGTIAAVYRWPGQNVRAGEPIMTIAATGARYIVSYLRQEVRFRPEPGMPVEVRARLAGARRHTALVERVGPQVELVPEHQRRDPRLLEWGLPVRISLPPELTVRPGELVDVYYRVGMLAQAKK